MYLLANIHDLNDSFISQKVHDTYDKILNLITDWPAAQSEGNFENSYWQTSELKLEHI